MHGSIRACRGGPGGVGCMRVLISAIALAIVCACAGTARGETLTFGKTRIGATKQVFSANRKRVNRYSLPVTGTVSQLSIYLEPVGVAGLQSLQGVLYADSAGVPGALLASSAVRRFSSSEAAGWYALSFATPIELSAGSYWIGVLTGETGKVAGYRYDSVAGARVYNRDIFTSGPSNPFGGEDFTDSEQMSLYATYTHVGGVAVPVNTSPPTVSGTPQQGQTLTEHNGAWSNEPTSFFYQWLQCESLSLIHI